MPLSKKRKKKRSNKPSGPPLSKAEIAARKRKLTKRQIFIYVFSALIILSFALSFVVGYGGGATQDGVQTDPGGESGILLTPVPAEDGSNSQSNDTTESGIQDTTTDN